MKKLTMNREDEICLVLQGLINGIDYDTGEVVEFSDKVKDSLKVIAASFKCNERSQQISGISEFEQSNTNDWDIVKGTFKEIVKTIKSDRPNHLVIVQNGYFYEILDEDATFFMDRFCYNSYEWHGVTKTGFPIFSMKVLSNLKEMKKSFVIVSQLPKGESQKVRRAISDVYDGDVDLANDSKNISVITDDDDEGYTHQVSQKAEPNEYIETDIENPCGDCGREIPKERLDIKPDAIRCTSCLSEFEKAYPDSVVRKAKEEGILTREGAKRMRAKQYGTNIHNKI